MRTKLLTALTIGMVFAVIAATMTSSSGASRSGPWGALVNPGSKVTAPHGSEGQHHGFTVLLTNTTDQFIDIDGQGPSQGDYDVFTDDLYRHGHKVGEDHGQCTVYESGAALCWGNFTFFGHGDISIQGVFDFSGQAATLAAVTGGTGRYTGADGTAELSLTQSGRQKFTFRLRGGHHHHSD